MESVGVRSEFEPIQAAKGRRGRDGIAVTLAKQSSSIRCIQRCRFGAGGVGKKKKKKELVFRAGDEP